MGYPLGRKRPNLQYFESDENIKNFSKEDIHIVNGVGALPNDTKRNDIQMKFKNWGYSFLTLVSNTACVSEGVVLGEGVQVMNSVTVNSNAKIGFGTILNTGTIVEHDCEIGSNCHLAPGSIICGDVKIGNDVFVGPGSILTRGISIGRGAIIGAGSRILNDVKSKKKVIQRI